MGVWHKGVILQMCMYDHAHVIQQGKALTPNQSATVITAIRGVEKYMDKAFSLTRITFE